VKNGHAEIVGAGFGGLVAAIALAERGWTARVHERRESLRGEGYGIAFTTTWRASSRRLASSTGCWPAACGSTAATPWIGTARVVMTRKTVRSPYRIDRQHIIALLAERALAAGVDIRFNSAVASADPRVRLRSQTASATQPTSWWPRDGINSGIRDQLGLLERRIFGRDCGARIKHPAAAGRNRSRHS